VTPPGAGQGADPLAVRLASVTTGVEGLVEAFKPSGTETPDIAPRFHMVTTLMSFS
jgi:hypothetical protein